MNIKEMLIAIGIIAIDLFTKYITEVKIGLGNNVEVIKNFFYLTIARNTGAAWSMLEGKMVFFYIITVAALIVLFYALFKAGKKETIYRLALTLMIAGAIGNFIDRLTLGYVRDFLDFYIFGYDFPIFNVADSSLCIGVFLLFVETFFMKNKEEENG